MQSDDSELTIRPARPADAPLLSALAMRSKAYWGYSQEFMHAVQAELTYTCQQIESLHLRVFVLERNGQVIGFHALKQLPLPDIELDALFVAPEFIGKGFGRQLLEHAKQVATELGAGRMIIHGDPNAESFYLAAGGVLTGRRESLSIPGRFLPTFAIELGSRSSAFVI